ncbi:MAG: RsmE family RNA methyltransferase [Clostridiaceae bacterium]|nr:RsmE family RNA methyltransferase [Clostridiaceae bacterium]
MPRFFVQDIRVGDVSIVGEDAAHIAKTLRLRVGETVMLSDGRGLDARARLLAVSPAAVTAAVESVYPNATEPHLKAYVYAALPKSDNASLIVQKSVELGAREIIFYTSSRTVRRPDDFAPFLTRLARIAREAAGQSERGLLPRVRGLLSFEDAAREAAKTDLPLFFYERGGESISSLPFGKIDSCAIFTGPEGGFSPEETDAAKNAGMLVATLGPRILRCETAPLTALTAAMLLGGEMDASVPAPPTKGTCPV